jgi:hypothetical protein
MALSGYRVLAWDMPGYGESPMLPAAQANAGDYADALARMLDRAGVEQAVLVGHSLVRWWPAPLRRNIPAACAIWCWPTSRRATARRSRHSGKKSGAGVSSRWRRRRRLAQTRAAKLLRPGGAKPMSPPLPPECASCAEGYLAAAWMLAHDDIHRWLGDYHGRFEVWCGEQDAITQPELVRVWRCATACRTPRFRRRARQLSR